MSFGGPTRSEEKRLEWLERMADQLMRTGTFCPICAGTGASGEPLKGHAGCHQRCRHCGGTGKKDEAV
jgi:DnaJ-class molecular chaperone